MLFEFCIAIMLTLIILTAALYIVLRVSPAFLDSFDEWLEPIREHFER